MSFTTNDLVSVARAYDREADLATVRENQAICSARAALAWGAVRRARDEERARAEVPRISLRSAS